MKITIPKEAKDIMNKLCAAGFQAYLVGGSIRDLLLERKTYDWDFATDATPDKILNLFDNSYYNNIFGTVGIPFGKKNIFEITTYRSESGYTDFRHPDNVIFGENINSDLSRRDFTVNALAYDGEKIIDLYNGEKDLKDKIIRCVGNPDDRFKEDALRMIRAVRLATQLEFIIEDKTLKAVKKNAPLINKISNERIRDELIKILSSNHPANGIVLLKNSQLLLQIIPELDKCFDIQQKSPKRHHIYDVGTHLVESLKNCPSKDPIVRLATLLHDLGKAESYRKQSDGVITFYNHEIIGTRIVKNIASRLKMSKKDSEKLIKLVRFHQFTVDEKQTDTAIRRLIRNVGKENLQDILCLRTADRLGGGASETSWRLELYKKRIIEVQKQPFTVADLKIDGNDVMKKYNIKPGPMVGSVLKILFNDVVSKKIKNEKKALLKRLKELKKIIFSPPKSQVAARR